MAQNNYTVESTTVLTSEDNGVEIQIDRSELDAKFQHELNVKVFKDIMIRDYKTIQELAERLLAVPRVLEVRIKQIKSGNSVKMIKDV